MRVMDGMGTWPGYTHAAKVVGRIEVSVDRIMEYSRAPAYAFYCWHLN